MRIHSRMWLLLPLVVLVGIGLYRCRPSRVPERAPLINLWWAKEGKLIQLDLEEYVAGVVAAEMPASFQEEALKAQAVAARTLALWSLAQSRRLPEHPDAQLSSDYRVDQAWLSKDELKERWGIWGYLRNWTKIRKAVSATAGEVLIYQGNYIFPAYHSTSGGRTEDSGNYWTSNLPYLVSVDSPYESHSPWFEHVEKRSVATVRAKLAEALGVSLGESLIIVVTKRFPSGRVCELMVNGRTMSGRRLREILELRSSWFSVQQTSSELVFTVKGYGHGVGMSQYGADGYAQRGWSYQQILSHYYQGASLVVR